MPSGKAWTDIDRQLALATCHHEAYRLSHNEIWGCYWED